MNTFMLIMIICQINFATGAIEVKDIKTVDKLTKDACVEIATNIQSENLPIVSVCVDKLK
jgi:hypothetical protein